MNQDINARIRDVFAVLPRREADAAARDLVNSWIERREPAATIRWIDCDAGGRARFGGVVDIDSQALQLSTDPAADPAYAELVGAAAAGMRSGDIVPAAAGDRLIWFAPSPRPIAGGGAIRAVAIDLPVFAAVLARLDGGGRDASPAEARTLFQLLAGLSPREAAARDKVSFETKRAHIKSLSAKLGCAGQVDLVRLAMGQLVILLQLTVSGGHDDALAARFAREHLPASIRLGNEQVAPGRSQHIFECGPPAGRPVLVVHGMLFPLILLNAEAMCQALNLRLVMPLRSGYFQPGPPDTLSAGAVREMDLDDAARLLARLGPEAVVLGHSVGASCALQLARRHPGLVRDLVLLSPNFLGDARTESFFGAFLAGLRTMTARGGLLRDIALQFRRQFADERVMRIVWRRLCSSSSDDLAVLDGRAGAGPIYGWFAQAYRDSVAGVADDMASAGGSWLDELAATERPVTVIAADDDPICGIVREWDAHPAISPAVRLVRMPVGGHFVCASHPEETWRAIAAALADRPAGALHSAADFLTVD